MREESFCTASVSLDLFPRNVLKDGNGDRYVIDTEFKDITNMKI